MRAMMDLLLNGTESLKTNHLQRHLQHYKGSAFSTVHSFWLRLMNNIIKKKSTLFLARQYADWYSLMKNYVQRNKRPVITLKYVLLDRRRTPFAYVIVYVFALVCSV